MIDVTDPTTPVEVGYYILPSGGYSCAHYNNYVLVGTLWAGLLILEYYEQEIAESGNKNFKKRLI